MSKDDHGVLPAAEEAVVESLLRAERIFERYRERAGSEAEFEPPSMTDRLLVAQIANQAMMAHAIGAGPDGPGPDVLFSKLDELRTRLFEELKAYVEQLMAGRTQFLTAEAVAVPVSPMPPVPPPTPEELAGLNKELEAQGAPDYATLVQIAPHDAQSELLRFRVRRDMEAAMREVRVVPANVHADFEDVLFRNQVDMPAAKRTLELLLGTPQGHAMLKLMVYDAVQVQRKNTETRKKQGG